MKLLLTVMCFFCSVSFLFGQEGFQFTNRKNKVVIPFKLVNNLIIIPVKVNGVELNFLLDSGVKETILFSLDEKDEVKIYDVQKIKLKGMGSQAFVEALKSSNNTLAIQDLECKNHDILIVLDQEFNFSSSLGIEVNGIIGYHFFKNNFVQINYWRKKINVFRENQLKNNRLLSKYKEFEITIENGKPYTNTLAVIDTVYIPAKCLIDTGNSDSVWLFESKTDLINVPDKNFDDFLGRGFSGNIFGKRAKIEKFILNEFEFQKPISSFPDSVSIKNVTMVEDRLGSIGGELLRRFNVLFDYKNNKMYLKKNRAYKELFKYNISGIEVHHMGLQWINEEIPLSANFVSNSQESHYTKKETSNLKYNFLLKPVYEIVNVRKDSPAEKAGLMQGDEILSINNKYTYKLSLQEINTLLKAHPGDYITLEIKRNTKTISFRFRLEELL